MITRSQQKWEVGQTVKVGFMALTVIEAARSYAVVTADFLTILDYAKDKGLTPKSESGRSLAFFLTTRGVGNLWFCNYIL